MNITITKNNLVAYSNINSGSSRPVMVILVPKLFMHDILVVYNQFTNNTETFELYIHQVKDSKMGYVLYINNSHKFYIVIQSAIYKFKQFHWYNLKLAIELVRKNE